MHITTLFDPADARLIDVIRIYTQAFPKSERKPAGCFAEMITRLDYEVVVAMLENEVAGFAVVFIPQAINAAALLEYVAVDDAAGGNGIGTALVRHAMQLAGERPLLMEVESASDEPANRRHRFYRQLGCHRLAGLRYALPLPGAPPMDLFIAGLSGPIATSQLHQWLTLIYDQVYGCPADDPRLISMIADLSESIGFD